MKLITLFLVVFYATVNSFAQNYSQRQLFMSNINCSTWSSLSTSFKFRSSQEKNDIWQINRDFKFFLDNIENQLFHFLETNQLNRAVVSCAQIEEQSLDFSVPCYNSIGNNVITQELKQACLSLHR